MVRNVWRQFGGWYDGNPRTLKPAPDAALAAELAALAGGADKLAARAAALAELGPTPTGCAPRASLAEWPVQAAPTTRRSTRRGAEVYDRPAAQETSLMAKGIYGEAADR